jgi:hypothetical protein
MYRNYTSKLYGFYVIKDMGYGVSESYGLWVEIPRLPTRQLKNLWGIREYGLPELWDKRASTVVVLSVLGISPGIRFPLK